MHAIPLYAIKQGLLTVEKKGKKTSSSGRVLEIEGLPELKVEQAFELADASAERSAAGCTIALDEAPIKEYLTSNIVLLKHDCARLRRDRTCNGASTPCKWLDKPQLLRADANASYAAVIDINLDEIREPIVCCPNDPDDAKVMSEVVNTPIDEVFIGSCMTNIGHALRPSCWAASDIPVRLRVAPPTKNGPRRVD